MRTILRPLRRFLGSEDGPTTVEYALLLAVVLTTVMSGTQIMGCNVARSFVRTALGLNR